MPLAAPATPSTAAPTATEPAASTSEAPATPAPAIEHDDSQGKHSDSNTQVEIAFDIFKRLQNI